MKRLVYLILIVPLLVACDELGDLETILTPQASPAPAESEGIVWSTPIPPATCPLTVNFTAGYQGPVVASESFLLADSANNEYYWWEADNDAYSEYKAFTDTILTNAYNSLEDTGYNWMLFIDYKSLERLVRTYDGWVTPISDEVHCPAEGLEVSSSINWVASNDWVIDEDELIFNDGQSQVQLRLPDLEEAVAGSLYSGENFWTSEDPAATKTATGSFIIVWGSPKALYLNQFLHEIPGEIVYREGQGTTYGVIIQHF